MTVVPRSASGASARIPAESWPLPPSITISPGSVAKLPSRSARRAARDRPGRRNGPCGVRGLPKSNLLPSGPAPRTLNLQAGLLRRPALEHDHRGDRVLGAEVGDVEIPRSGSAAAERERVRERLERVDPLLPAALAAHSSCASASFALRSASSRRRRLSPRSATRTLNRSSRRLAERSPRSSVRSRIAGPSTTSRGTTAPRSSTGAGQTARSPLPRRARRGCRDRSLGAQVTHASRTWNTCAWASARSSATPIRSAVPITSLAIR